MGVSWYSEAEVISTEPEVIKQLIEEIAEVWVENEDTRDGTRIKVSEGSEETAPVYDLRIEGNSVLFHSSGYGCYGSDPEYRLINFGRVMLFKCLFDKYDKALVCFEIVQPCQGQGYYFSTTWAKPDGKIDWISREDWDDDDCDWYDTAQENSGKTFSIVCDVDLAYEGRQGPSPYDDFEDICDLEDDFYTEFYTEFSFGIWFLSFQKLDRLKLPSIKKLINLAQEAGYTDWVTNPSPFNSDNSTGIMMDTLSYIEYELRKYSDKYAKYLVSNLVGDANNESDIERYFYYELGEYSDKYAKYLVSNLVGNANNEAEEQCKYGLSNINISYSEFEFPADFPELKSAYAKAYEKKQAEIENEEKLNLKVTLLLRTKNSLIEFLQAGNSGAWDIGEYEEQQISQVQIFNWDGSLMLEAPHDVSNSKRTEDNLLIVGLSGDDAKIIKCNPPFTWVGQNSVNYLYEAVGEKSNDLTETETETIDDPPPHAPDGCEAISNKIAELCETTYGEPIILVYWQHKDDNNQVNTLFRERRRGWYIQMLLTDNDGNGQWTSEHRVLPSFLNLLKPDETTWAKLTKKASQEDWYALDEIFFNTLAFPGSKVILAGSELIGQEVADEAMERFGFYIPQENVLPVLLFENSHLKVKFVSYFKHPDGFAKENMISDDNTDQCEVIESLLEAQQRLNQKLSYYKNES